MITTLLLNDGNSIKELPYENPEASYIWSFKTFIDVLEATLKSTFYIKDIYTNNAAMAISFDNVGTFYIQTNDILTNYEYCLRQIIINENIDRKFLIHHNRLIYAIGINLIISSLEEKIIKGGYYG